MLVNLDINGFLEAVRELSFKSFGVSFSKHRVQGIRYSEIEG